MKMYQVGGCVRDEILGVKSKDIDYSVVLESKDFFPDALSRRSASEKTDPFSIMVKNLEQMGFKIFLETPEHLTVRAQFPRAFNGPQYLLTPSQAGLTADFVLARKEGTYTDGRRPDTVEPGTLMDDQSRRDFTMNAIAKDSDGCLIDPFNGVADIQLGVIRAVGDPVERLAEDALRALRALRFSVTKDFFIHPSLSVAMQSKGVADAIAENISDERISDELSKMFRFDSVASIVILNQYPLLTRAAFSGRVSLDSTLKTKGRG